MELGTFRKREWVGGWVSGWVGEWVSGWVSERWFYVQEVLLGRLTKKKKKKNGGGGGGSRGIPPITWGG